MPGLMLFANNAATTLAANISNVASSLTVAAGTGSLFPNPTAGQYFFMTLANTAGTVEIVKVTARSTDVFTITRGQDNTSAVSWTAGDKVEQRVVAADFNNVGQLDSTNTWALAQTFTLSPTITALAPDLPVFTNGSDALTNTGVSPIANGGTNNGSLAVTAGGIVYTDGTKQMNTGAGTLGQVLVSAGAGTPAWTTLSTSSSNVQTFNASGTWTKPAAAPASARVLIEVTSGGGSGGRTTISGTNGGSGGGGGGGYVNVTKLASNLGATETVTVGLGGTSLTTNTAGNTGGTSSFGSWLSVVGGGGGADGTFITGTAGRSGATGGGGKTQPGNGSIGGGGGIAGNASAGGIGLGQGFPGSNANVGGHGGNGLFGGGGGGPNLNNQANSYPAGDGGDTYWGGGGGGGSSQGPNSTGVGGGGTSVFGGAGGAGGFNSSTSNGIAGTAPGGGGGGCAANGSNTSGAGGNGQVVVTTTW
jgi:hypothetical protein